MKSTRIAITYEKGGCGKTTTAVNLSAIFAEKGYKVLLVDLDFQSYATSYFDLYNDESKTILEVMCERASVKEAIVPTQFENLYLLPSKYAFKDIETILMMKTKRQEYTLQTTLSPIVDDYDFIILDCPPNGARIKENALAFANKLILPTIPDDYAVHGLRCMATELVDITKFVNQDIKVLGILLTLYENTVNKKTYTQAIKNQTIFPTFNTVIRKNTTLSEAINHHKPINHYNRKCIGYDDYLKLADEILSILEV